MTRDEIAQMMQDTSGMDWGTEAHFQRFAKLVYEKAWADTALAATHTITDAAILKEREACAKDAEWCIQNHLEHLMPERIRARSNP